MTNQTASKLNQPRPTEPRTPTTFSKKSAINLPNTLTAIRICGIPAVVYLSYGSPGAWDLFWSAAIFGLAFATDYFDGYLARKTHRVTKLGKIMDPMADKMLVATALLILVHLQFVSVIIAIIVLGRELAVSSLRTMASSDGKTISSTFSAKAKTWFEGFGLSLLILGPENRWLDLPWMEIGRVLLYIGVVLALWSGGVYFHRYFTNRLPDDSSS